MDSLTRQYESGAITLREHLGVNLENTLMRDLRQEHIRRRVILGENV